MKNLLTAIVCVVWLLLGTPNHKAQPLSDEKIFLLPAVLVNELERWVERADFWRLVTRAEFVLDKLEIREIESKRAEAWICTPNTVCITSGLRQAFTPAELNAAIAHEIGHIVIPRPANGNAQLWEMQCDLLAVALTRNADTVKDMLYALDRSCRNCRDAEHLTPFERIALLDNCASLPLEKVARLDALRKGNYAIPGVPPELLMQRPTVNE